MDIVHLIIDYSTNFLSTGGILFGFLLVFSECFIPALPLSAFVALNVNAFGLFVGILVSWVATTLGSFLCYLFFCYLENKFSKRILSKKMLKQVKRGIDSFQNITFTQLVFIITLPFSPSSLINVLAGLSNIPRKKFLMALIIGKAFCIVFWGYVGKSILVNLTDWYSLLYIFVALMIAYIISKIVGREMNII